MRWRAALGWVGAVGALTSVLCANGVAAEVISTPPGQVATVQASLAMDNDWQFVDSECLLIPVVMTYGRADETSIIGETQVTKVGTESTANDGTFLVLPGDPVSGRILDEVFVCPADGTGQFSLNTIVRAIDPASESSFALDPLTFWVAPAISKMSRLQARHTKGGVRISGQVAAGRGEATGIVELRFREPGQRRWSTPESLPVDGGSFAATIDKSVPPGTKVKATLTRCSWCTRVSARTVVR